MADPASAGGKPTAESFGSLPNENNAIWEKTSFAKRLTPEY
jgi:hypothetical protein